MLKRAFFQNVPGAMRGCGLRTERTPARRVKPRGWQWCLIGLSFVSSDPLNVRDSEIPRFLFDSFPIPRLFCALLLLMGGATLQNHTHNSHSQFVDYQATVQTRTLFLNDKGTSGVGAGAPVRGKTGEEPRFVNPLVNPLVLYRMPTRDYNVYLSFSLTRV